jgi:tetratricopeptide (TPR) repeat protein
MRFRGVLLLLLLSFGVSHAQQTFYYFDKNNAYRKGVELFEEKNYASARKQLEEFYQVVRAQEDNKFELLSEEIAYMIAISAAENNDPDAEVVLFKFLKDYPASNRTAYINFFLGRYYYQNNKYQECIDKMSVISEADIPEQYRDDYKFQLGYCYFVKKKFAEAKPLFGAIKERKEKYFYPSNYYYAFISFYEKDYNDALKSFLAIEDSKMFSSVIPYYVAQIYYLKKDYSKTAKYIADNIGKADLAYKNEMNHLLGESYFQLSEYAKALPLLEKYVAANEKVRPENIYELAYSQYKTGLYQKAADNFVQLNLLDDKMGQNATYTLADCYLKLGEKEKAKAAFQSAASKDFDANTKANAQLNFGKLALELGSPTECVATLETFLSQGQPDDLANEAGELMALALLQSKDYDRAYNIIEKLRTMTPALKETYQRVTYFRAIQLYNDNEIEDAIVLFDKSLKYPVSADLQCGAYLMQGEINYKKRNYREATIQYQKFIQLNKPSYDYVTGFSEAMATYNTAYVYFKQKDFKQAQLFFKKYLTLVTDADDNTALDAQLRMAECSFVQKDYRNSLTAYSYVASSLSEDAEYAQFQKAIVLGLLGRADEKIAELKSLINKYPGSKTLDKTYFETGDTYLNDDDAKNAIQYFSQLIQNYPYSALVPASYLKIALAEYNRNDKDAALKEYKKVMANYPSSPEAKQAALAIKQLGVEMSRPDVYADLTNISQAEKDTLTFYSAENAYNAKDCEKAVKLLGEYISAFPKGFFIQTARYYRSECNLKNNQYEQVLADYDELIKNAPAYKERSLLNASGIAYFELMNYERAQKYYEQLLEIATTPQNTYTAIVGVFKTTSKGNKDGDVMKAADRIIEYKGAKETDLAEAHFLKAKAAYRLNMIDEAFTHFNIVAKGVSGERAAESKYMTAKILNQREQYKMSLDTCFKIKAKFASYEYWYVKNFVLMADNYYKLNNVLQAKATLESIVANYTGDKTLLDEAKAKLDEINASELKKSIIEIPEPSETLIMEQPDSIPNSKPVNNESPFE